MNSFDLGERMMMLIPLILSLTVHEWAHAWSAFKLGDDTASRMGRLNLNPLSHIDPIGTVLLPLMGIPFGWAKPVPVRPENFRRDVNMRTGMAITAAAGPISNLVLAFVSAAAFGLLLRFKPDFLVANEPLKLLLLVAIQMNVGLAVFNLLPIPPLDGSRIVERIIPPSLREAWDGLTRYSPFILIGILFLGRGLLDGPISFINHGLQVLIRAIAV